MEAFRTMEWYGIAAQSCRVGEPRYDIPLDNSVSARKVLERTRAGDRMWWLGPLLV